MKRGRKPKPSKIHELEGGSKKTHRKPKKNEAQPESYQRVPSPPAHLNRLAKNEWRRVAKYLHAVGLLTKVDRAALAAYCVAYATWVNAQKQIEAIGVLVKAQTGFPMQSPYLAISNKAMEQMLKFLTEFGMTPSSRTRVKPTEKKERADPLEQFIAKGQKLHAVKGRKGRKDNKK
jgi:P27 family predicted phage terminase small subunit